MIDLRDWQRKLHAWCIAKYGPQTLERRGLVMGEELGEVQAAILKRAEGEPIKEGHDIQDELPQLLIGLLVTAECVGLDMETALEQAFAKVNLRLLQTAAPIVESIPDWIVPHLPTDMFPLLDGPPEMAWPAIRDHFEKKFATYEGGQSPPVWLLRALEIANRNANQCASIRNAPPPVRGCYTCAHYTRLLPESPRLCNIDVNLWTEAKKAAHAWLERIALGYCPGESPVDYVMIRAATDPCPEWKSWK